MDIFGYYFYKISIKRFKLSDTTEKNSKKRIRKRRYLLEKLKK